MATPRPGTWASELIAALAAAGWTVVDATDPLGAWDSPTQIRYDSLLAAWVAIVERVDGALARDLPCLDDESRPNDG